MHQLMTSENTLRTSEEYIPRDDASEVARLTALGGFGQVLFEEDVESLHSDLAELGLHVNTND